MTIRRNYSNTAAATTLSAGITDSSTALSVASVSGYPEAPFTITVGAEVILVGGKSGTTLNTLTRGYDGTSASAHLSGAAVEHRAIADDFDWRWVNVITQDDTDTVYDDEFDDGDDSGWTQVTPTGTATWTEARGNLSVLYTGQSANDCAANLTSLNGLSYPLYVVTAMRAMDVHADFSMHGPVFTNGTTSTSSAIWFMPYYDNSNPGRWLMSLRSGTLTNISTSHWSVEVSYGGFGWAFLRLDWVSTNSWRAWASPDGVSWTSLGQSNVTFSMTPTDYGLGVSTWGTSSSVARAASFENFRAYTAKPSYWQEL